MKYFILFFTLAWSATSFAHARLKPSTGVAPRSTSSGLKVSPCGGIARVAAPPTLIAGQKLTVTWEETVDHPGRFEFSFSSANDQNFTLLSTVQDTATGALPHQYSTEITLPNVICTDCTLQMIQVMTENPLMPTFYYSCADMKLVSGATPTPTTTPIATPTPNCK